MLLLLLRETGTTLRRVLLLLRETGTTLRREASLPKEEKRDSAQRGHSP